MADIVGTQGSPALPVTQYPQGVVIQPERGIFGEDGSIVLAQATVEEKHTDDLEITEHPVELGASITDHAFKRPAEIVIQMAFSNTPSIISEQDKYADPFDVKKAYQKLLKLQESRTLLHIETGKRRYDNMLIKGLVTTTDNKTENAMFITVLCRQIIIVKTQTVELPKAVQATPAVTASPVNRGGVQTFNKKNVTPFADIISGAFKK